jgi:hypothetical protein
MPHPPVPLTTAMSAGIEWLATTSRVIAICVDLVQYVQKIRKVDATLAIFAKEIEDFSQVLGNIQETFMQLGVSGFIDRCGKRHWDAIANSLIDVEDSLQKLDALVKSDVDSGVPTFVRRTKEQLRLDWNAVNIENRRKEIVICRQMLMISLNMVQVYAPPDQDYADNSTSMARQEKQLDELRSIVEDINNKIQHSPLSRSKTMKQLQGVLSAESWIANASSKKERVAKEDQPEGGRRRRRTTDVVSENPTGISVRFYVND